MKTYETLKQAHIADYQQYFNRVDLHLGTTDVFYFPTDARLIAIQNGNIDPQLLELYYQFWCYLFTDDEKYLKELAYPVMKDAAFRRRLERLLTRLAPLSLAATAALWSVQKSLRRTSLATAGNTEMLMQSHAKEIELLPALPTEWQQDYIHSIVARGGFEVDIAWENGKLKRVKILSKLGNPCQIRYGDKVVTLQMQKGKSYMLDSELKTL